MTVFYVDIDNSWIRDGARVTNAVAPEHIQLHNRIIKEIVPSTDFRGKDKKTLCRGDIQPYKEKKSIMPKNCNRKKSGVTMGVIAKRPNPQNPPRVKEPVVPPTKKQLKQAAKKAKKQAFAARR